MRKQARPGVRTPTARAAGLAGLAILVDAHERYAYRFARQQAGTVRRALPAGDYAVERHGRLVAVVERKSLPDLVSSLTGGRLVYALGELAALPRAAVVVEERYSSVFKLEHVRPSVVADGLAELQVRWPGVPIVFCETRRLAEEWTYRYLAAALAADQDSADTSERTPAPAGGTAGNAEIVRRAPRLGEVARPPRRRPRPERRPHPRGLPRRTPARRVATVSAP